MPGWSVDGMDVRAVERATHQAITAIRGGGGPCFLEYRTYRFRAHSMYDPDLYRDPEEVAAWRRARPDPALSAELQDRGLLDDAGLVAHRDEIAAEIDRAVASRRAPRWSRSRTSSGS
jgi:pyruvate dehydrogenase E1 component alpha subunit